MHHLPHGIDEGQTRWPYGRAPDDFINRTAAYPYPLVQTEKQVLRVPDWCNVTTMTVRRCYPINEFDSAGILSLFDNTPRRVAWKMQICGPLTNPKVVVKRFRNNLEAALHYEMCCLRQAMTTNSDDHFIQMNSWNEEWPEGMRIEPSDGNCTSYVGGHPGCQG